MTGYVDASSQTEWAGLMQKNIARPDALYPSTDTPPDEPLTDKEQCRCVASLRTKSLIQTRWTTRCLHPRHRLVLSYRRCLKRTSGLQDTRLCTPARQS